MKSLQHILGEEWTITSSGGSTGEAYFAQSERGRLFLKRNSSPFLAVLSAEGIVPKLVWTKRLENGDVITAQQWLEGRELTPEEMQHPKVAKMLSKIHHSSELLDMLMRIEKKPLAPKEILSNLKKNICDEAPVSDRIEVHQGIKYLEQKLPFIHSNHQVVCHCDMNHNNWLVTNEGQLYLVDWDNARIGDPAMDTGMVLHSYIPEEDWDSWLEKYGETKNKQFLDRMYWFLTVDIISHFLWHQQRDEQKEAAQQITELKRLLIRTNGY